MKYITGIAIGLVLAVVGYWVYVQYYSPMRTPDLSVLTASTTDSSLPDSYPKPIADVRYTCTNDKTMHAVYFDEYVIVELSDGRTAKLPHALSADGARYANSDESLVFWNRGTGAFVQENGMTTYDACKEIAASTEGQ